MGLAIYDERNPNNDAQTILPADTTTRKVVGATGKPIRRVDAILLSSTDTVDRVVLFETYIGTAWVVLGSVTVPAATGMAGTPCIDAMPTIGPVAPGGFVLSAGANLAVSVTTTVTAAKQVQVVELGGYF